MAHAHRPVKRLHRTLLEDFLFKNGARTCSSPSSIIVAMVASPCDRSGAVAPPSKALRL
jgi:hypothetical protein